MATADAATEERINGPSHPPSAPAPLEAASTAARPPTCSPDGPDADHRVPPGLSCSSWIPPSVRSPTSADGLRTRHSNPRPPRGYSHDRRQLSRTPTSSETRGLWGQLLVFEGEGAGSRSRRMPCGVVGPRVRGGLVSSAIRSRPERLNGLRIGGLWVVSKQWDERWSAPTSGWFPGRNPRAAGSGCCGCCPCACGWYEY